MGCLVDTENVVSNRHVFVELLEVAHQYQLDLCIILNHIAVVFCYFQQVITCYLVVDCLSDKYTA